MGPYPTDPSALVAARRGPAPISPPGRASPAQELFPKRTAARAGRAHKGSIDFPSKGYLQRSARGKHILRLYRRKASAGPTSLLLLNSLHRVLQHALAGETDVGIKSNSCSPAPPGLSRLPQSLGITHSPEVKSCTTACLRLSDANPQGLKTPFPRNLP